eukprot:g32537.t1
MESIFSACTQDTAVQLRDTAKQTRQRNCTIYMHTKNKKLEKLAITTSSSQASPDTTVENGTTTGKSIVNRSDYTLPPDEIEVLSRGFNFCPTTKMDPIDNILQLIRFILDHNVFTFDNQFFIQTRGTAMGTKFALQYANIFMHRFEQDFFA